MRQGGIPPPPRRPRSAAAVAAVVSGLLACAPGRLDRIVAPDGVPAVRALLVHPVSLLYEHDPLEAFVRTRHVLQAVMEDGRLEPMSFEDMKGVLPGAAPDRLLSESSLAADLEELGLRSAEVLVLTASVSRSIETGVTDLATSKGEPVATRRSLKAFLRLRMELWHPHTGRLVAVATDQSKEDLLLAGREGDPSPHLTRTLRALARRAIRLAASFGRAERARRFPFDVVENPYALGVPRPPELSRAPAESAPADTAKVLVAEAAELERLRFLEPAVDASRARVLREGEAGLLVVGRHGPLESGDRVLLADGKRVATAPALWRAWMRTERGADLSLTVARSGRETVVKLAGR